MNEAPSTTTIIPSKPALPGALDNFSESVPDSPYSYHSRVSLLEVQALHSPSSSMRRCFRSVVDGAADVLVRVKDTRVSVFNNFLCRNQLCSFCSYKRGIEASNVLSEGLKEAKRRGYFVRLITLTIPTSNSSFSSQRELLSGAYRRFSKNMSRRFKKQGSSNFGMSWSFDLTLKNNGQWYPHLHIHGTLVSDVGSITTDEMFREWEKSVQVEAGKPLYLSRKAFYCKEPYNEKAISRYLVGKFLSGLVGGSGAASEVHKGASKGFKNVGGGIGWIEFLRYLQATNDLSAVSLYKEIIKCNHRRWWSSVGKTIKLLATAKEEDDDKGSDIDRDDGSLEVSIPARGWLELGKIKKGFRVFLYLLKNREKHPNRYAAMRKAIEEMRRIGISEEEIKLCWKLCFGLC